MSKLVKFDLHIDASNLDAGNSDFMTLLDFLLTSICGNGKEFSLKKLTGGYANDVFRLTFQSQSASFVLRIFRNDISSSARDQEIAIQHLLANNNLATDITCRFSNGICYRYIEGEPITRDGVLNSVETALLVGVKMAAMHDVSWHSLELYSFKRKKAFIWPELFEFFDFIESNFNNVFENESVRTTYKSVENLRQLLKELEKNLEKYKDHPACALTICHNDLLFANMIFTSDAKNDFRFIDFEYANINYCSYDIANFFCEFAGVEPVESLDYDRYFPSYDYQFVWLKNYIKHRSFTNSLSDDQIEQLANQFYVVVQKCSLLSHFFWSVMALFGTLSDYLPKRDWSQLPPKTTLDYVGYAERRFNEFLKRKDKILAMDFS